MIFEIISVAEGIKPMAILTHLSAEDLKLCKKLNLKFRILRIPSLRGDIEDEEEVFVLYKDKNVLREFIKFVKECKDEKEYVRKIGEFLGYPHCCIEKFIDEVIIKRNRLYEITKILEFFDKFINCDQKTRKELIFSFPFNGFYPCKLPCENAVKISKEIVEASSKYLKNPEKTFILLTIENLIEKLISYNIKLTLDVLFCFYEDSI